MALTNKMLTEVKNNYKSILKHFDFDESVSSADYKRQKFIEMAKNGEDRPSHKTKEGHYLSRYTIKSSGAYCPEFDKTIRKLRPDWFEKKSDNIKQKLIEIAKSGMEKPNRKIKEEKTLLYALKNYTIKSSNSYDESFDKLIRKLRPDWFEKSSVINKQLLLNLANTKKDRPSHKTKLGRALSNYCSPHAGCQDREFIKQIRSLRPDWFRTKKKLLKEKFKMENNMITCKEVVDRFVLAQNPAYKAHATRMLNAYVVQQCSTTGANPTQIIAGVKAAITKRKRCL